MTKIIVEVDQKFYNLVKEKLPWATENMQDFAEDAMAAKFERLLMLLQPRGEKI